MMKYILVFLIAFTNVFLFAQDYSTSNKKAIKKFELAKEAYYIKNNELAKENSESALKEDWNFAEVHLLLAQIYQDNNDKTKALDYYKNAIRVNPSVFPTALVVVAELELELGNYDSIIPLLKKVSEYKLPPIRKKQAERLLLNAEFALNAIKNPVPFNPINLGAEINSESSDYFPCLTADESKILITRLVSTSSSKISNDGQEDFYFSYKKDGKWQKAFNIGGPINTILNEGAPTLSVDGNVLIFTACSGMYGYGPNRDGLGSCDFFFTRWNGNEWSNPVNLGIPVNTPGWESQPCLASDGKTIYFLSNRKGGLGGSDIWSCELGEDGYWGQPQNLGETINTEYNEQSVFIHPDNQTLYFSSQGHVGMGGLDIFMSRKDADGKWQKPINLGFPINTSKDENSVIINAEGDMAYFASNREGGYGNLDIYSFELYPDARPQRVTYFKGFVFDEISKKPIVAKFELIDLETQKTTIESFSNKGDGSFFVCLPTNKNYALNVSNKDYLFFSENFSLKGENSSSNPFIKNVPLSQLKDSAKVILRNIFFETASYTLKKESEIELNKLYKLLSENPNLHLLIGGHTDNVGSEDVNLKLSENRAKSVVDYLINKGISSERLKYKGYGESNPIDSNDTEEGRKSNRRTDFTVIKK